jgi:hypothetical protein
MTLGVRSLRGLQRLPDSVVTVTFQLNDEVCRAGEQVMGMSWA